jgi:hypothetical protein
MLVDAPDRLLEICAADAPEDAPCDVAVCRRGTRWPCRRRSFTGAEHDWSAVELGPVRARNRGTAGTGQPPAPGAATQSFRQRHCRRGVRRARRASSVEPTRYSRGHAERHSSSSGSLTADAMDRSRCGTRRSPHHPTLLVRRGLGPGSARARSAPASVTIGPGAL